MNDDLSWREAREYICSRGYGANSAQLVLDDLVIFPESNCFDLRFLEFDSNRQPRYTTARRWPLTLTDIEEAT